MAESRDRGPAPVPNQVVVFDLSTLTFTLSASRRSMTLRSAAGESLAVVSARPAEDEETVAFRALTQAVDHTRVLRTDDRGTVSGYGVALYNPFTAQLAYTSAQGSVTFACPSPCPVPSTGVAGTICGEPGNRTLTAGELHAVELVADMATAARSLAAYS